MTVIIAAVFEEQVIVAADSCITIDDTILFNSKESKLVRFPSGFVAGGSGSGCVIEMLHRMSKDKNYEINDRFDVYSFAADYGKQFNELEESKDKCFNLLLCTKDRIWFIVSSSEIHEIKNYWSIGSGSDSAIAILSCMYEDVNTLSGLKKLLTKTIQAVMKQNRSVGGEIEILVV